MKSKINEDGSTSYTLSANERMFLYGIVGYWYGKRVGYTRGRTSMAKELPPWEDRRRLNPYLRALADRRRTGDDGT